MRSKGVDKILHEMAMIFANEGIDSTEQEMREARAKEDRLIEKICLVDPELGSRLRR